MANDYSSTVSGILAQALVTLPRIIMADLYVKCQGQIGTVNLVQFRIDVSKWLHDGTIPGYDCRKGPFGGIYRAGAPNETAPKDFNKPEPVKLDPAPIAEFIENLHKTQPRVTLGDLAGMIPHESLDDIQFKAQMSKWLHDGITFPQFVFRKGPMGGVYPINSEVEKFVRTPRSVEVESEDGELEGGEVESFTIHISPTLQITQSNSLNWTIQKKSGDTWMNHFYHPTLDSALNSVSKHIINGEFKMASSTAIQLKDLASMIQQMESRLTDKLKDVAKA